MGARGPAPQPTALKVINGNPGHRAINKNEPSPEVREPPMPAWLDDKAQEEWRRIVPILLSVGLLTVADGTALTVYCETYSTYIQANEVLHRDGFTFLNEKTGVEHARPEVGIVQQCRTHLRAFSQEFGLTPSSRGRMTMPGQPSDDDQDSMKSFLS